MGQREAGALLNDLLAGVEVYREQWLRYGPPQGDLVINGAAVARRIAAHLYDVGELLDTQEKEWARKHVNLVYRALSGQVLTEEFLLRVIDAFAMSSEHSDQLKESRRTRNLRAGILRGSSLLSAPGPMSGFRTVSVREEHHVDARGLPARHYSTRTIEAVLDGLRRIDYRFDAGCVEVAVTRGGHAGRVTPHSSAGGPLWRVEVDLDRPAMRTGEQRRVEYTTVFDYDPDDPPDPVFRRGGAVRPDGQPADIEVVVRFHPDRLPAVVERCVWNRETLDPVVVTAVKLGSERIVRVGPEGVALPALIGFRWSWD